MEYNPQDEWRRIAPEERARQFMPFAALRGYYDLIREAALSQKNVAESSVKQQPASIIAIWHAPFTTTAALTFP